MVAEVSPTFRAVQLADAEQPLIRQVHLAEPTAAQPEPALAQVGPVDDEDMDLGVIEQPRPQVLLGDLLVIEHALDVEVVDRHADVVGDR